MPLLNNAEAADVLKQATTPTTWANGDIWVDTDDGKLYVNVGGTATEKGGLVASGSTVYPHSTTIGDYTTPTNATASSTKFPINDNAKNASNTTVATGNVYVVQFTGLTVGAIIAKIGLNLVTAAGNVRVKVYDVSAGEPGALLGQSGSVATSGTGFQDIALTTDATVPAGGVVWAGFENDSASLDLKRTVGASGVNKRVAHTYGAGPDPFGAVTNDVSEFNVRLTFRSLAADAIDTVVTTANETNSEANANIYVDMNSSLNLAAIALHKNTADTMTTYKIQTSTDAVSWTDRRTVTASNITASTYTYWRFNIAAARYVRVYGSNTAICAFNEIRVLTPTDSQVLANASFLAISSSDTTLNGAGQ